MSNISEKITDSNKGVVCWFYVYKNENNSDKDSKRSICGIVIIKQLISDNGPSDKEFFFTETKRTYHHHGREGHEEYTNNTLISDFINTTPTYDAMRKFEEKGEKFLIFKYNELQRFLSTAIKKNFEMFDNWLPDDTYDSYISKIRNEFSRSISSL
jgi:hypothetical protein